MCLGKKIHERLNKVANVAQPSVFSHLHTLAFYVAVKSRKVFAWLLQFYPHPSSPFSLRFTLAVLHPSSSKSDFCGKQGERFEESHKAEALVQRAALRRGGGWW